MSDVEFEVTAAKAQEWAREFRTAVEQDPQDTEENRRRIFCAYLLFCFAESMKETVEEAVPDLKRLN